MRTPSFRFRFCKNPSKGFTLVELLVVIGIIAILFAVVLIAVNPAKRFAEAHNVRRQSDVKNLLDAISQHIVDHRGDLPANIPEVPTCIGSGNSINNNGGRMVHTTIDGANLVGLWGADSKDGVEIENSAAGLVGLWHLNETSGNVLDSSGKGNNGTPNGTLANFYSTTGKFGNGSQFNGTNNFINISDNAALRPENDSWTVSLWANPANVNQAVVLLSKRQNVAPYEQFTIAIAGDAWTWASGQNLIADFVENHTSPIERTAISSADVADGNWHHYVMVADKAADIIRLYMDGVELTAARVANGQWPTINNADPLRIGDSNGAYRFNRSIDEVALFNRALSSDEIQSYYSRGLAKDKSVNALDGKMNGPFSAAGKYKEAFVFDGSNDYVAIPDNNALDFPNGSNITIAAWVKPDTLSGYQGIVAKGATTGLYNSNYQFKLTDGGGNPNRISFYFNEFPGGNWHGLQSATNVLSVGTWQHVAVTYTFGDDSSIKFYHNGNEIGGSLVSGNSNAAPIVSNDPLWIGASDEPISGSIDIPADGSIEEVAIWNRTLSGSEIQTLATRCYHLAAFISSEYLVNIPKDPQIGTDVDTGYTISRSREGIITIGSVKPEAIDGQTPVIQISR